MSTIHMGDAISRGLFGETRRVVLCLLFGRPDESFYLREIARHVGSGQGAVQRELGRLTAAGIVTRTRKGKAVYYQANPQCPVFAELSGLMRKTGGLADVLRRALAHLSESVDCAFIYGSHASDTATARSDVDLLLVGDVDEMALHRAVSKAEEELARPVNYTLLSRKEFARRRRERGGFLARVLAGDKIPVIGKIDGLR